MKDTVSFLPRKHAAPAHEPHALREMPGRYGEGDVFLQHGPAAADSTYWDSFYTSWRPVRQPPSQFAAFVAGETVSQAMFIDVGCGTGRDSFFFASLGHAVLGIDASEQAVASCLEHPAKGNLLVDFVRAKLGEQDLFHTASANHSFASARSVVLYSRFFLHAITESEEEHFLRLFSSIKETKQVLLASEFRTHRDEGQPKATPTHYRRYIDPQRLIRKLTMAGNEILYFVEGFGLAKYKQDDAHVARLLVA